jgi:glutamyl/glutaminyl-tRNA synthetase
MGIQSFRRTRIAPTPSGFLHLGNVLSFVLTAGLARRSGASILLRIDDLDRDRVSREYVEDIFGTLSFLGIPWDEGPRSFLEYERTWSQVHRLGIYREALERLRASGKVFACDCSRSKIMRESAQGVYPGTCRDKGLSLDNGGCSWRVRAAGVGRDGWRDGLAGGDAGLPVEMTDFVVRKKDGYPAYQLTSVIDDLHFGVDLVVRGDDLRASTAAQRWLAGELGLDEFRGIRFYHHALLMESKEEKLSKSAGSTSVRYLRQRGVKPREIYTMILQLLGSDASAASWEELYQSSTSSLINDSPSSPTGIGPATDTW